MLVHTVEKMEIAGMGEVAMESGSLGVASVEALWRGSMVFLVRKFPRTDPSLVLSSRAINHHSPNVSIPQFFAKQLKCSRD